jgi:hypothetical protein
VNRRIVPETTLVVSAPSIRIDADVSEVLSQMEFVRAYAADETIYGLAEGVERGTMHTQAVWVRNAAGNTVNFDGKTFRVSMITGEYVRSIQQGLIYPNRGNPYWGRIQSTSPHAIYIEMGRRVRSGPEVRAAMLASGKAKTAKDGSRYITIPFRHGTPGTVTMKPMPQSIYEEAKSLPRSKPGRIGGSLKSIFKTKEGHTIDPTQFGRRTKIQTSDRPFAPYTWKKGPYAGMTKQGKSGQTQYMTFRRISSKTQGQAWAQPEIKPRPVAQASAAQALPEVQRLIMEGLMREVAGG